MTTSKSFNVSKYFSENSAIDNIVTGVQPVGIQVYNTVDDLPLSGVTSGSQAYVNENNRLYMWTGAGWFSIALINTSPSFDSGGAPEASYELDSAAGTPLIIQLSATDPEDLPIQWSYVASDSAQYFADITNDSSVFTITALPTTTIQQYDSAGGTFSVTFKASDGVNLATALSEFTITFSTGWDLSLITYDNLSASLSAQEGTPRAITFKPDGTKMYMIGGASDRVWQYTLTDPWDITTLVYDSKNFSVTSQESIPYGLEISDDGTKMWVIGTSVDTIFQYTLSTPWEIDTASYDNKSLGVGGTPRGLAIKSDGSIIYTVATGNPSRIKAYALSTPFDVSTGTKIYETDHRDGVHISDPFDLYFKDDGTKLYLSKFSSIHQYTLSIPWDLSTLVNDGINYDFSSVIGSTGYFTLKVDGTKLYAVPGDNIGVHQFTL